MASLVGFLCAVAGIRRDALARAPQAAGQAATVGALLLMTATLAGANGGYALRRVFLGESFAIPLAVVGGIVWATVIFAIDRLLVIGMDGSGLHKGVQVLLRAPLAIILGFTLSKPMLLNVTRPLLEGEVRRQARAQMDEEAVANARNAGLPERQAQLKLVQGEVSTQRDRVKGEPDTAEYSGAVEAADRAEANLEGARQRNNPRIARARQALADLTSRFGESGEPEARAQALRRIETLEASIANWRRETAHFEALSREARDTQDRLRKEWFGQQRTHLQSLEQQLAETAVKTAEIEAAVAARNAADSAEVARLMAPSLVREWTMQRRLAGDPTHPDHLAARSIEIALDLSFILLELLPVMVKAMVRKTPLDAAMVAVEFEEEERIALDTNRRVASLRRRAEAATQIEDQAVERWRQNRVAYLQGESVDRKKLDMVQADIEAAAAGNGHLN